MASFAASRSVHAQSNATASQKLAGVTIFCDFDGPLVDVSERYYNTYQRGLMEVQRAYRTQGISIRLHQLSKDQFWQMKRERTPDVEIAMRSGLQGEQIQFFLRRVEQIVNQPGLLHQDQLQPGVKWALSLLHAQGARLVVVTLRRQAQAAHLLHQYGIAHLFAEVWGTQDQEAAYINSADQKTQLLAAAIAANQEGYHPHRAWMIGDTEADVLAGRAAGIATIALTCGIRSDAFLKKFQPCEIHVDLLAAAHRLIKFRQPMQLCS